MDIRLLVIIAVIAGLLGFFVDVGLAGLFLLLVLVLALVHGRFG